MIISLLPARLFVLITCIVCLLLMGLADKWQPRLSLNNHNLNENSKGTTGVGKEPKHLEDSIVKLVANHGFMLWLRVGGLTYTGNGAAPLGKSMVSTAMSKNHFQHCVRHNNL